MKLATLCYLQHNGQTLMIHRVKKVNDIHQGKWNGLGGKLEQGESPEQCVIREVKEESGFDILFPRYHGLLIFADFKSDDWYVWVFTAKQFTGEMLKDSSEGNLHWIEDEKVESLSLWPSDKVFFPWLKGEKVFSARFQYAGEELLGHDVVFY